MWEWLRKQEKPQPSKEGLHALLFGDVPLRTWAGTGAGEPWAGFSDAATRLQHGDRDGAVAVLRTITERTGLESRHYLGAWHALRGLRVMPPAEQAKHLHGVVVDVPVASGLDTVAAYEDRTARYINHSGKVIVWEAPGASAVDERIEAVLSAGRSLVRQIGPWEGERPVLPPGLSRISLLTPSGLHFGQAPMDALAGDPLAAPVINSTLALMKALMASVPT